MFGLTVRRLADCPTSVVSMSARLEPSQSSDGSEDAFRKGKIANETAGATGAELLERPNSLSRSRYPLTASNNNATAAAINGHRVSIPAGSALGFDFDFFRARPDGVVSFQLTRSSSICDTLW